MKKNHLILLIILLVAFGIILSSLLNTNTYSTFSEARTKEGKMVNIIGTLEKNPPFEYSENDMKPMLKFWMKDGSNTVCPVYYFKSKPRDFEKVPEVVITGFFRNDSCIATELLLKCPSKYTKEADSTQVFGK